jgi:hypothetical protein
MTRTPPTPRGQSSPRTWHVTRPPGTPHAWRRHGTSRTRGGGEGGWLAELAARVVYMGTLRAPHADHFPTLVLNTHNLALSARIG